MIKRSYTIGMMRRRIPVEIHINQYDTDYQLLVYVKPEKGTLDVQSGTTVELRGRKPDGTAYTKQVYLSGNNVVLQGDRDLSDIPGKGVYELCFTRNGKWLSTANFIITVEPSPAERN